MANIYVVDEIVFHSRVHPDRIGSLHTWLFHGDATRGPDGVCTTYEGRVTCEDIDLSNLHLTRSGRFFPPLFSPGVHLVLREDALRQIDSISRMFLPKQVIIAKCI